MGAGGGWVPVESLVWGALVPVVGVVLAEKGDGGDYGVGGWFSCCWMWSSALPWELWPFLPPILDAGDLCGVLVLFHPCSSTWYLPLAPPDMGSSGFWGAPTLCFLGEGGAMHPLPAQCSIAMTTRLEAAWMQAVLALLHLFAHLRGLGCSWLPRP